MTFVIAWDGQSAERRSPCSMPKKSKSKSSQKRSSARPAAPQAAARPRPPPARKTATGLSKCSDDYAKSLMNPWGPEAPCLPSGFPLPSLKRKFFARGTAVMGTTTGYVCFNPTLGMTTSPCIGYSSSAYAGTQFKSDADNPNGKFVASLNSSYAIGAFGGTALLKGRVVSAGIRLRYDGTELNRGGRIIPIEHPTHGNLVNSDATDALKMQGVQPVRPSSDGKWITVVWAGPKDETELGYLDPNTESGQYCLGILLVGGVASNFVCEWECWANYEIVGVSLSGQTISHHDPVGASLAANAVSTAQQVAPHSSAPGFAEAAKGLISKYATEAVTDVASFAWDHKGAIAGAAKDLLMFA